MKNYFVFFGLTETFEIDQKELEAKYYELQNQFHPDSSDLGDIEKSMLANEAYKTLSDDFLRACHLLALLGIDILHDETAAKADLSTLEEILELQEKLDEITSKPRTDEENQDLRQIHQKARSDYKLAIQEAMLHFKVKNINVCAQKLIKARYLNKILQEFKS